VISGGQLLAFTLASIVIIVVPGPGVLFVVGRALSHGRRAAIATAGGHAIGNYTALGAAPPAGSGRGSPALPAVMPSSAGPTASR
jgi:hypothetical protein